MARRRFFPSAIKSIRRLPKPPTYSDPREIGYNVRLNRRRCRMAFTLQIGQAAPDFNLPGADGKNYSLGNFADAKVLVVVFSCNHCPFVIGSEDRMNKFLADYAPKGVAMVAINSNET